MVQHPTFWINSNPSHSLEAPRESQLHCVVARKGIASASCSGAHLTVDSGGVLCRLTQSTIMGRPHCAPIGHYTPTDHRVQTCSASLSFRPADAPPGLHLSLRQRLRRTHPPLEQLDYPRRIRSRRGCQSVARQARRVNIFRTVVYGTAQRRASGIRRTMMRDEPSQSIILPSRRVTAT